jgi:hypothetical protein
VWLTKSGEVRLNYVQSRQIYAHFYERAVIGSPSFEQLKTLLTQGNNLAICGYDAFPMELTPTGIEAAYMDPKKPFGHERCLVALLVLSPDDYPWRKHQTLDLP